MKTFAAVKRSAPSAPRVPLRVPSPSSSARRAEVRQILHGPQLQPKLTVGEPDDKLEREADRVADQVMWMPDSEVANSVVVDPPPRPSGGGGRIQRLCKECQEEKVQRQPMEDEEELVQAKERPGGVPQVTGDVAGRIRSLKGGGQSLPESARAFFEPRFGADFSGVRVHADSGAGELARRVQARAFTVGQDVVFGQGQYAPDSGGGKKLLAHELTHTIQQSEPANRSGVNRQVVSRREIDKPRLRGTKVEEYGIAYKKEGVNLRDLPGSDPNSIVQTLLPFNSRMYVDTLVDDHYFVGTDSGQFGYVATSHVKLKLPEPDAKIYHIEAGDTALGISRRHYGGRAEWGRDHWACPGSVDGLGFEYVRRIQSQ